MGSGPEGDGATIHLDESRRFLVVGERRWPVVFHVWEDIRIEPGDGVLALPWAILHNTRICRVAFENGWAVSVSYGSCTYGDNYHHRGSPDGIAHFVEEPTTVEAALFHRDTMIGDPRGWVDAETLTSMLHMLVRLPSNLEDARGLVAMWVGELSEDGS